MSETTEVVCPHCGAINRVPQARLREQPDCGRCHRPLFPGHARPLSGAEFDRYLQRNQLPVLVDFWAEWCGPCKMMAPHFEKAAAELAGAVQFAKLDTEAEPAIASRYAIRGIPTLILFEGGRELRRVSGAMTAPQLVQWLGRA